ncbi:CHAT domain-containing protein [Glycomyces sp. NPDC047010]|uniref:CHAT domain-containing protein n=1 Tax=Glycomyces sp. NPDC047010 TaxID=3155023 RepID=UPI0033E6217A
MLPSDTEAASELIEAAVAAYLEEGDLSVIASDQVNELLTVLEDAFNDGTLPTRTRLCDAFAWAVWCAYRHLRSPEYFRLAFAAFDPADDGRVLPEPVDALGLLAADRAVDLTHALVVRDQLVLFARATQEHVVVERAAQMTLAIACMMPAAMQIEQVERHAEAGQLFYAHYERTADTASLIEAYAMFRFAFQHPDRLPRRGVHLYPDHLLVLTATHDFTGDSDVLDELIEVGKGAQKSRKRLGSRYPACLSMLGAAYRHRFEASGDPADAKNAVDLARRAVAATPRDDPNWFVRRGNLAAALLSSQQHEPDRASLEECTDLLREAAAADDHSPDLTTPGMPWTNLALAHLKAFELFGDREAIDAAILAASRAVERIDENHPQAGRYYWHLGIGLQTKWMLEGDSNALHSAFLAARTALEQTPAGHPYRPERMVLVAFCLVHLHDLNYAAEPGTIADLLAEADTELRLHLTLSRTTIFAGLAATALRAHEQHHDVGIVRAASGLLRTVIGMLPDGDAVSGILKVSLGTLEWALRTAGEREIDTTTLLSHLRAAYGIPPGNARIRSLLSSAPILFDLATDIGDPRLADEALAILALVADDSDAEPDDRYLAATVCATRSADAGRYTEALRLFSIAVDQMPLMSGPDLQRQDQERRLARMPGAATDAAACAIRARDPAAALQILERGRNILGARMLHTHAQLDGLRDRFPELAAEYEALQLEIRALNGPDAARSLVRPGRYPALRNELAAVVARIRTIEGFDAFHAPSGTAPPASTEAGPVVTINFSRYGSSALLTTSGGTEAVPLPDLTETSLTLHVDMFDEAIRIRRIDQALAGRRADAVLRWLWDAVAEPALDALGIGAVGGGETPRVWWIPTGALSFLPIHAAGHHDRPADQTSPTVLDRCVSSYAASIGALAHARRLASSGPDSGRGLIVAVDSSHAGVPDLPGVALEVAQLHERFPGATILSGPDATPEAVLELLPAHTWVHFACHATSDITDPASNGLVLHGGVLTVEELLANRRLPNRMAYLSACDTGRGGVYLADEAIHLASAMQIGGFPHTVGTLWAVRDRVSRLVSERVYRTVAPGEGTGPDFSGTARALHDIVKELRDARPLAALQWAPYIHYGP